MKLKTTFGKVTSFLYATGQTVAESIDTTLSIDFLGTGKSNLVVACTIGAMTGVIEFMTSYYFQGAEIRKRIANLEEYDSEDEEKLEEFIASVSKQKKSAFLTLKYGYIVSGIAMDYLRICLLYSAGKAWTQDLITGDENPLTLISQNEGILLLIYYILFDLPLIFTAEMPETCKGIRGLFNIHANHAPDNALMSKLFDVVRPFARSNACRKSLRVTGSIADTIEHVGPLAFIVPTPWILEVAQGPAVLAWGSLGISSLTVIVIAGVILTQTYLFEGKFSEQNLKKIANQFDDLIDEDTPWINPRISKLFHYLLYLGGPLHGIDTGLSILLALRELETPTAVTTLVALSSFLVAWMGNHYSEVKESQSSLQKITLEEVSEETSKPKYEINTFFFQNSNYGTIKLGCQKVPMCLLEDEVNRIQVYDGKRTQNN